MMEFISLAYGLPRKIDAVIMKLYQKKKSYGLLTW